MSLRAALLVLGTGAAAAAPLNAASYTFGGLVDLRAGYGDNPGLTQLGGGGSGFVGGSVNAGVTRATELSTTLLTGTVDLEENFRRYGLLDNYTAALSHNQRLTPHLNVTGDIGYQNIINRPSAFSPFGGFGGSFGGFGTFPAATNVPVTTTTTGTAAGTDATTAPIITTPGIVGVYDPAYTDYLAFGQRNERFYGDVGGGWTFTARDSVNVGGSYSHSSYGGRFTNSYNQYGAYAGIQHTFSEHTRAGVQYSRQWVDYSTQPQSTSDNISLTLFQQLSAHWTFNGSAGLLIGRSRGIAVPDGSISGANYTSRTLSLAASLCGDYTRLQVCFSGNRQSAPSGIGGLRIDTDLAATVSYRLTERSTINAQAGYDHSVARRTTIPAQDFYSIQAGYNRTLTRRISLGGTGRYYKRDYGSGAAVVGAETQSGWAVSGDVIYRFGRQ